MRLLRTTGTVLSAATAALAASGCSFLTGVRGTSRVTVTVAPDVIGLNQQAQALGTSFDGNTPLSGRDRYNVTFTSRDPNIATVDEARGIVIGKAYGSTYIIGQNRGERDSALVTVRPVQAVQVVIGGNRAPTFRVGAPNGVGATAFDSSGRAIGDRPVTWTSRDAAVLTVSGIGAVTPLAVGTTWIVASIDNGPGAKPALDSVQATVTQVPIASVVVTPNVANSRTPTVYVGQTLQFTATLTDSLNASTSRPVTWSTSDNGRVLSITQTGVATGVAPFVGTTNVAATVDIVPNAPTPRTLTTTVAVQVLNAVDSVRVFNSASAQVTTLTVAPGSTTTFNVDPIDVVRRTQTGRVISLVSSNPAVASVPPTTGGSAQITAGAAGTATITIQALDYDSKPQGRPSTLTVTVQ